MGVGIIPYTPTDDGSATLEGSLTGLPNTLFCNPRIALTNDDGAADFLILCPLLTRNMRREMWKVIIIVGRGIWPRLGQLMYQLHTTLDFARHDNVTQHFLDGRCSSNFLPRSGCTALFM